VGRLELKVPPLVVAAIVAMLMWVVAELNPALQIAIPFRVLVAGVLLLAGVAFAVAGVLSFRAANTTVNPMNPGDAASLVTSGVYAYSRNPMYVGFLFGLLAWGVLLANPFALCLPVGFVLYLGRFQIRPEEVALELLFGAEFRAYRERVRRWL